MIERDPQAFQDVRTVLGLCQVELGPARHYLFLVGDVMVQYLLDVQHARFIVHQRQHVHAEGCLHGSMLVQLVQNHVGVGVAPQLNDYSHAFPVRLVAKIADAVNLLVAGQFSYALHQTSLVDLVWNLGNNYSLTAAVHRLDLGTGP
ncbi:MAG: hypothetical protein BWY92_01396 [Firmicutes bacterium ADurb.BinA052]|nr:MAG: hypothetical protein BWY92_01396 [Firmicutes bacterium ADurb.BinA052]